MSLKKIEQVKKDRGFKIFDLIVYGAVIVAVIVSFVVIFTTKNSECKQKNSHESEQNA